ncbi:MAG: hypothetical protein U0836_19930 [Pirellulales bacterium]
MQAIADPAATATGLASDSPRSQRAALVALAGMDHAQLTPAQVLPLLSTTDEPLRREALLVLAARPEWAEETAHRSNANCGAPAQKERWPPG